MTIRQRSVSAAVSISPTRALLLTSGGSLMFLQHTWQQSGAHRPVSLVTREPEKSWDQGPG